MDESLSEPGCLDRCEKAALDDDVGRKILDLIGQDMMRIWELEEKMDLERQNLKDHLSMLEEARLVEQEDECYRLTPRCIAYLNECQGYEWRR